MKLYTRFLYLAAILIFLGCDHKTEEVTVHFTPNNSNYEQYSLAWWNQKCTENPDYRLCCNKQYGGQLCFEVGERIKRAKSTPEDETKNMELAAKIADRANAMELQKFCSKIKGDKGCLTAKEELAPGCILSTDDSGRCVIAIKIKK